METIIGQILSHHVVPSKLGSGGMGVVHEDEDTDLEFLHGDPEFERLYPEDVSSAGQA